MGPKPGQRSCRSSRRRPPIPARPLSRGCAGTEHRFAQVLGRRCRPAGQELTGRARFSPGPANACSVAVVDARECRGRRAEKRHPSHHLMIRRSSASVEKRTFAPAHVVVVVEDRDPPPRPNRGASPANRPSSRLEDARSTRSGGTQALWPLRSARAAPRRRRGSRIEIAAQHLEVAVGVASPPPPPRPTRKKLRLAQVRRELLDGPAKVAARLLDRRVSACRCAAHRSRSARSSTCSNRLRSSSAAVPS